MKYARRGIGILAAHLLLAHRLLAQPPTVTPSLGAGFPVQEDTARPRMVTSDLPMAERNYVHATLPNARVGSWFEAYLSLQLPAYSSYRQSLSNAYQRAGTWSLGQTVSAAMQVNLRMTREKSAPVRTPSYMPRVRWQLAFSKRDATRTTRVTQWVTDATVGHYSNGQDGCLFVGQVGPTCAFAQPVAEHARAVNRHDGSFSSHYVETGVAFRRMALDNAIFTDDMVRARSIGYVALRVRDYRLLRGIGGGMSDELRSLYGAPRIRVSAGVQREKNTSQRWPGQTWIEGFVEALPGASSQVDPVRVSLEIGKSFDRLDGMGVFARLYTGQDDYNLGFLTNLRVVHFGVAVGGEGRSAFRR